MPKRYHSAFRPSRLEPLSRLVAGFLGTDDSRTTPLGRHVLRLSLIVASGPVSALDVSAF